MSNAKLSRSLVALGLLAALTAHAAPVVFTGVDAGAGPGAPRPTANTAATNFDTAASVLGTVATIDFETAPLGSFSSLTVAPGVTLSGLGAEIADGPLFSPLPPAAATGYNTTSGGKNFVQTAFSESGATGPMTFTFTTPIEAFGAYLTGVQADDETITFDDGSSQTVKIPNSSSSNGGVEFVGFTDSGKSISSITINVPNGITGDDDEVGIDDVRFVTPTASSCPPGTSGPNCSPNKVPEPTSLVLLGLAVAAVGLTKRRKLN